MIEDIQKARFLNNIYKMAYAYGEKIDENTIKSLYSSYFRANPAGAPLDLQHDLLRTSSVTNVDYLNNMMIKSIYNMDVLYDAAYDAVDELFDTVTSLNNRIDSLRSRRASLEKKVDDIIFSITNSDGYYASYSEEFHDISSMDTKFSTVYLDQDSRSVSLSSVSSGSFNRVGNNTSKVNAVQYSVYFNGAQVVQTTDVGQTSSLMFDGLNDTYWKYTHSSQSGGIASLQLSISPVGTNAISKVFGRISSEKPVKILLQMPNTNSYATEPLVFSAQSENDHDNFVFNFDSTIASVVNLMFVKNEPDRMINENGTVRYEYDFIIRDIVLSGLYYNTSGVYVSNPIKISSTDNAKNVIDAVALECKTQNLSSNSIDFYVAKNVENATSIDDFKWLPISPENMTSKNYPTVVNFNGTNFNYKTIVESNATANQTNLPYFSYDPSTTIPGLEGTSMYKVAKLNPNDSFIEPIILEGFNRFTWYRYSYEKDLCTKLDRWKNTLLPDSASYNIVSSNQDISSSSDFWTAPSIREGGSVLISFEILMANDLSFEKLLTKNDDNSLLWDVCVYLNGSLLRRIQPGQASDTIAWQLKEGKNNVTITIDAPPKATSTSNGGLFGSFTLMQQSRISDYGLIYQNYLSYIAPQLFKNNNSILNNVFSIQNIDTLNYIISNKKILVGSRIYYYSNNTNSVVDSLRVRADFSRAITDPRSTPVMTSYKIKFRRSEQLKDISKKTASDILRSRS